MTKQGEIRRISSEDVNERLNDPNFNIDEWIEGKNKALAESLFKQYQKSIRK